MNFTELSKLSIESALSEGARFVRFTYVISLVVITFRRESKIYFIRKNDSASVHELPYTMLTLVLGWWGIPWGPIYTIGAIIDNLSGGRDVTKDVIESFNNANASSDE